MPMHDFECTKCTYTEEEIVPPGAETINCASCGGVSKKVFLQSAILLTTIIPDYPGCKKKRAGYVHTHGDKSATKVQSGPGGCLNPS